MFRKPFCGFVLLVVVPVTSAISHFYDRKKKFEKFLSQEIHILDLDSLKNYNYALKIELNIAIF